MKIKPAPDGSASVIIQKEVITVSPQKLGASLQCLLEEIAKLEERVGALEAEAKKKH